MGGIPVTNNKRNRSKSASGIMFKKIMIVASLLAFLGNPLLDGIPVVKAATQLTYKIDYTDETITLPTPGLTCQSTKFYISTDEKKSWELIEPRPTDSYKIDISGMLSAKEVKIYIKGNKETEPMQIVLQAEENSLKPEYKVVSGAGVVAFTSSRAVQYRKGANGSWINVASPLYTAMYEAKGATLFFRQAPTADLRAGKVVTVKISKRPSAPSVRLDGSKLCISGMKAGATEYRIGDSTTWFPYTSSTNTSTVDLSFFLGGNAAANMAIPGGIIEIRSSSTDKKVASTAKIIEVPPQVTLADTAASLTNNTLTINDTDTKKLYEYTVVPVGYTLDLNKARWSNVTSSKPVTIPKIIPNDRVVVRIKSIADPVTKQTILASTFIVKTVTATTH